MFLFLRKKAFLKGAGFAALVFLAAALAGCDTDGRPGDEPVIFPATLLGEWASDYDAYEITEDTLVYDGTFAGAIKYFKQFASTDENSASGVFIVKYTSPPENFNFADGYTAVYFKGEPGSGGLQFGTAYTVADWTVAADVETLGEAVDLFAGENYFTTYIGGWYGTEYHRDVNTAL